jgi:predicted transposase/invertase (TIGR01784 family)
LALVSNPHDKFFKAVFSGIEHARSELVSVLPPAVVRAVDWTSLTLISGEHTDAVGGESLESDLLFTARLEDAPALLYLLFEHQSSVDRTMPFRLLRYMTRVWERFAKDAPSERLPIIIPLVLHHGERGWTAATQFRDLLEVPEQLAETLAPFIPDFTYVLDDLCKLDDDALRGRALTDLARVALLIMQRCRESKDPGAILRPWAQTLVGVLTAPNGREALRLVARYTAEVSDAEPEPIFDFFAELGPEAKEIFMTTADRLRERGIVEGHSRGIAEGRILGIAEGQAALLARQLGRKFGPLSETIHQRLKDADLAELELWADRLLAAESLEEVFKA